MLFAIDREFDLKRAGEGVRAVVVDDCT